MPRQVYQFRQSPAPKLFNPPRQAPAPRSSVKTAQPQESSERDKFLAFLGSNGLLHLADLLLRHGFEDLETLAEISDSDLVDLGVGAADAAALRGALRAVDESHPVVSFLREVGLRQHVSALLAMGFDDMETLLEIEEADMRAAGLPRGHALRLARRLRERRVPSEPALSSVQRSWQRVQRLGSHAIADRLCRHIFRICPEAERLFPVDVRWKYRDWSENEGDEGAVSESPALRKLFGKIVNAVGLSVAGLHQPAQMVPMLTMLGARHLGYGVDVKYWHIMGEALNCTLKECLGQEFTSEVEAAWTLAFRFISAIMIEGLKNASEPKTPTGSSISDDALDAAGGV